MRYLVLFIFLLIGLSRITVAAVNEKIVPNQQSSYLMIDLDSGETIDGRDADKPRPIASLTKLMTALVAKDNTSPHDILTVPSLVEGIEPTIMGLSAGEKLTIEELLYGLLLPSGNDAAETLAYNLGGRDAFVARMNDKAETLGMTQTHFRTPTGFDVPGQYSSARDLATLTQTILKEDPLIEKVIGTYRYQRLATTDHKTFRLTNGNIFLDPQRPNKQWTILAGKIGNTPEAGGCIVVEGQIREKKVLLVLLGSQDRESETVELFNRAATKI
ncbi:MAG: serine hydrolase [bacterium]|nr:serine hydrolase [bacterium]